MKRIGYLTDNQTNQTVLVECTEQEFRAFRLLADAAQGRALSLYPDEMRPPWEQDLAPAFNAIFEWIEIADRATVLHQMARTIENAIKHPSAKEGA